MGRCLRGARTHQSSHCSGGESPRPYSRQHMKKQHSAACSVRGSKCQRSGPGSGLPCLSPFTGARARSPNNSKCHGEMTPEGLCTWPPTSSGHSDLRQLELKFWGPLLPWSLFPGLLHEVGRGRHTIQNQHAQCDLNQVKGTSPTHTHTE